ncbi:hypothetical protein ABK040_002814 [Willaertia magna]
MGTQRNQKSNILTNGKLLSANSNNNSGIKGIPRLSGSGLGLSIPTLRQTNNSSTDFNLLNTSKTIGMQKTPSPIDSTFNWRSKLLQAEVKLKELVEKYACIREGYKKVSLLEGALGILDEMARFAIEPAESYIFRTIHAVFSDCLFIDKSDELLKKFSTAFSEEEKSLTRIPFFTFYVKEKWKEITYSLQEKAANDYESIEKNEEKLKKMMIKNEKLKKSNDELQYQVEKAKNQMEKTKEELRKQKKYAENVIEDLKQKLEESEHKVSKLRLDVRQLRAVKEDNDKKKNQYSFSRKEIIGTLKEMHSLEEDTAMLKSLFSQLEILENKRIDDFESAYHKSKEAMVDNYHYKQKKKLYIKDDECAWEHAIGNDLTSPMLGLDALSLRSYIEIYQSRNGKNFKTLYRAIVTPHYTPEILELPSGTTHIKVIHSKYNYTNPHPNIDEVISSSKCHEIRSYKKPAVLEEATTTLTPANTVGKIIKSKFGTSAPSVKCRNMTLLQVREIIFDTYMIVLKGREHKKEKGLELAFIENLEKTFLLPEIVHKVSYEFLKAIDEYRLRHADILAFYKSLDGIGDTAFGSCVSIALYVLRNKWLQYTTDIKSSITKDNVTEIINYIYIDILDEVVKSKIIIDVLNVDTKCLETNQYYLNKLNTYFIVIFRDVTEHYCEEIESIVLSRYNREYLNLEDFVNIFKEKEPYMNEDILRKRFIEATKKEPVPVTLTNQSLSGCLSSRNIGCKYYLLSFSHSQPRYLCRVQVDGHIQKNV